MKTFKQIMLFVFIIGIGFIFSVPCEAASLFHKEDFEDNNKMDTFGADSAARLDCLMNSSWIITGSCESYGTTVTPCQRQSISGRQLETRSDGRVLRK